MPFFVVDLEDGVVFVPTKCIVSLQNGKYKCYYPPSERASKMNEMISKLVDPELTWKQYDVLQYLKRTDTFKKGREKLLEALVMSEIDSDVVDNYSENYKRSRNNRAKVISSSTSQNSSIKEDNKLRKLVSTSEKKRHQPQIVNEQIQEPRIPLPPIKRIRTSQTATEFAKPRLPKNFKQNECNNNRSVGSLAIGSPSDPISKETHIAESALEDPIFDDSTLGSPKSSKQSDFNNKKSQKSTSNPFPKKFRNNDSTIEDPISDNSSTDASEIAEPELLKNAKQKGFKTKDVFAPSTSSGKGQSSNDFTPSFAVSDNSKIPNASKPKMLSNLDNAMASLEYQDRKSGVSSDELILAKLNEIILLLRNMKIQSQSSCGTTNDRSFFDSPKCPKLPINTKKDLMATSDNLNDKNLKIRMINALGSIGGRDVKNVVANVCSKLFTNKVALLYSWSGRKSKLPLKETNFANLIIRSVKVCCPNENDHTIQNIGSKWFAQAKSRLTRELSKEKDAEDDGVEVEELRDTDADDEED